MNANTDRLFQHVEALTGIIPARYYPNQRSLEKAAAYIESVFKASGGNTERQHWNAGGMEHSNIIASYNTSATRRLIVGAHYDVCGDQPGADDNASAVAGLLELATLVFQRQPMLNYRIDFVTYSLEEPPFFGTEKMGSYIHARSLHRENTEVIGMICLEMIGFFSDIPNSQPYPSPELAARYSDKANFIIVVGIEEYVAFNQQVHQLMVNQAEIDVQIINFKYSASLAGLSDQRSYWAFGYPALMINDTSFIRNPNYHQKSDTIDTLDFEKMGAVVNATFNAIIKM